MDDNVTVINHTTGFAILTETKVLVVKDFCCRKTIMQLDQVNVFRANTCHLVGLLGRNTGHSIYIRHG